MKRPADGFIWVYPSKKNPTYGFTSYDWDNPKDGVLESGKMIVSYVAGGWNESAMFTEFNSFFVIGPVNDVNMKKKTVFHENGVYYSGDPNVKKFSPADQKIVSLVQKLYPESAFREKNNQLWLGYQPLHQLNDILSLDPPEGFKLENKLYVPNN